MVGTACDGYDRNEGVGFPKTTANYRISNFGVLEEEERHKHDCDCREDRVGCRLLKLASLSEADGFAFHRQGETYTSEENCLIRICVGDQVIRYPINFFKALVF